MAEQMFYIFNMLDAPLELNKEKYLWFKAIRDNKSSYISISEVFIRVLKSLMAGSKIFLHASKSVVEKHDQEKCRHIDAINFRKSSKDKHLSSRTQGSYNRCKGNNKNTK